MLVAGCGGVLQAIDRKMLERFDGKHGRFNVRYLRSPGNVEFRSIGEHVARNQT